MLKFNDQVREILKDVNSFLTTTLEKEELSPAAVTAREELVQKLQRLCREHPHQFLTLDLANAEQMQGWKLPRPLSSPHPYLDMQIGAALASREAAYTHDNSPDYVYSDTLLIEDAADEVAEPSPGELPRLETRPSVDMDEQTEDGSVVDIPASELSKADKTGILEKKGKERLGGLLSPFQKRWCAIKDGVLYLYEKTDKQTAEGSDSTCLVRGSSLLFTPPRTTSKKDAAFEIRLPWQENLPVSLPSNTKDMKQWISAIEKNSKVTPSSGSESHLEVGSNGSHSASPSGSSPLASHTPQREHVNRASPKVPAARDSPEIDRELSYEYVGDRTTAVEDADEEEPLYEDGESYLESSGHGHKDAAEDEVVEGDYQDWYLALWDCLGERGDELSFR
uniref:Putative src kinase-associated phosphoprotein 2 n=1 Tax=Ixodes ricinus TaxID=34613 RepID=V5I279_IXORI